MICVVLYFHDKQRTNLSSKSWTLLIYLSIYHLFKTLTHLFLNYIVDSMGEKMRAEFTVKDGGPGVCCVTNGCRDEWSCDEWCRHAQL